MDPDEKITASPQTAGEHIRDEDIFVTLGGAEDGYQLVVTDELRSADSEKSEESAESEESETSDSFEE